MTNIIFVQHHTTLEDHIPKGVPVGPTASITAARFDGPIHAQQREVLVQKGKIYNPSTYKKNHQIKAMKWMKS